MAKEKKTRVRDGKNLGIIVGISGASGVIFGVRLLQMLQRQKIDTHVVMTESAKIALAHETALKLTQVRKLATHWHDNKDIASSLSSGSFPIRGMIVAPCSVKSLAEIANGVTTGLLSRTADVTLKERRRLVLMVRETPLHRGHLLNMLRATEMGAIIAPPVPAMYAKPTSIEAMIDHNLGRILDLFDMESGSAVKRWRSDG